MAKSILLMYSNHRPTDVHLSRLKEMAPEFNIEVALSEKDAIDKAADAEVILGHRYLRQSLPYTERLRWVQATAAGIDRLPIYELKKRNLLLTRTTFPAQVIAQHAYMLAWALIRKLKDCLSLQQKKEWRTDIEMLPYPKTALIVGFGHIGREIAKLLKASDIVVYGLKRSLDEQSKSHCDKLINSDSWRQALSEIDICFLCLPLTSTTKGFFDESALQKLPRHAVVVNVGRGSTLDTKALIRLLKQGRLGGAGLDVLDVQPPPTEDEIWQAPNLILTPYVAGRYPQRTADVERYIEQQLQRYFNNQELENIIDWDDVKI